MQKREKMIKTDPRATQEILTGNNPTNLEIITSTKPTAREGNIKGNPSLRTDIVTYLAL
jgi:hypothetical protein